MNTWQYDTDEWTWTKSYVRFEKLKFQDQLRKRGAEGWELVSMFNVHDADCIVTGVAAVFKRPTMQSAGATPPPIPK